MIERCEHSGIEWQSKTTRFDDPGDKQSEIDALRAELARARAEIIRLEKIENQFNELKRGNHE